jgi:hypothetical protein
MSSYSDEEAALPHLRSRIITSKRLPAKIAIPVICVLSALAWMLVIATSIAVCRLV